LEEIRRIDIALRKDCEDILLTLSSKGTFLQTGMERKHGKGQ
jgi:hypothetical protein